MLQEPRTRDTLTWTNPAGHFNFHGSWGLDAPASDGKILPGSGEKDDAHRGATPASKKIGIRIHILGV